MELGEFLRAVRRAWWVVVLSVLCLTTGMFFWSSSRTPLYQSSAQVFVTLAKSNSGSDLSQGVTFVQAQVASYAQLVTSPIVLDPVAEKLGVTGGGSALKSQVSSSSSKETVIISIVATDPSAPRSAQITQALATQLGVAIRDLAPRNPENLPTVQTVIISRSAIPTAPSSPKVARDTAAAGLAGLLGGGVLAGGVGLLLRRRSSRRERSRPKTASRAPVGGLSRGIDPPVASPVSSASSASSVVPAAAAVASTSSPDSGGYRTFSQAEREQRPETLPR